MEKLQIKDVPQDYLDNLKKRFEEDERIRQLRIEAALLQRSGKFVQALQMNKKIEEFFARFVEECIKEAENETRDITIQAAELPQKDAEEVTAKIVVLFMMLDIIDSVVVDIDDILQQTSEEYSFTMLDSVRELAKETRLVLRNFEKSEGYMKDKKWGDVVDNVYQMINNKSRKIIKKKSKRKEQ